VPIVEIVLGRHHRPEEPQRRCMQKKKEEHARERVSEWAWTFGV
jgi:hypothetical protein